MEPNPYQQSIFTGPGKSGWFSRNFFNAYNRLLSRIQGPNATRGPLRMLLVAALLGGFCIFLLAATAADFSLVYNDSGYERPSIIYAKGAGDKWVPIAEFYRFNRRVIDLSKPELGGLNSRIARAFIATEDNNFKSHPGLDPRGILRAAIVNILAGRIKEGASTITQQVARLRFLTSERSYLRKIREAFLALVVETRYSKEKIMELYLNEVPLGHGTIGVEAAARFYFNKKVSKLSWGEAALLASLTTRPRDFSPLRNLHESRRKVRVVFQRLIETGVMDTDTAAREYAALENDYYRVLNRSPNDSAFHRRLNAHPYASEYVKYVLPRRFKRKLYTGGLRIYTTIRVAHQKAAEDTFIPHLKKQTEKRKRPPYKHFDRFDDEMGAVYALAGELFDLPRYRVRIRRDERKFHRSFIHEMRDEFTVLNRLFGERRITAALDHHLRNTEKYVDVQKPVQGSLISIRPVTGEITAVVGGAGFTSKNQLLRFTQSRRRPGSSFKPIVYAAGIEYTGQSKTDKDLKPLTAATVIDDSPTHFVNRDQSEYSPENYNLQYHGPMRLRRALALSKNTVAVKVYERMGPARVNPIIEKILALDEPRRRKRKLPVDATLALGTYPLSTLDMTRAFSVFASGGRRTHPHVLLYVKDSNGEMLKDYRPVHAKKERTQVVSPGTAEIITSMLRDAVARGTGRGAFVPGRSVAGKTGTTDRYTDAWFVGFTPNLVAAVQISHDRVQSLGAGGAGGTIAAPAWRRFVAKALQGEPAGRYRFPGSRVTRVAVSERSGKRMGPLCSDAISEMFLPGTAPTQLCTGDGPPDLRDLPGTDPGNTKGDDRILGDDL